MAPLVRCPHCDTFVKTNSLGGDSCPFCPAASAANIRNPIPGLVLVATIAAMPACSKEPNPKPVAQPSIEETDTQLKQATQSDLQTDASQAAQPNPPPDPQPAIYGIAPDDVLILSPIPEKSKPIPAKPDREKTIYGGPPGDD